MMFFPDNSERDIQLRRYWDALAISGEAVIIFSLWDIVKIVISMFLGEETIAELVSSLFENTEIPEGIGEKELRIAALLFILVIVLGISALTFLYHLYL